MKSEFDLNNLTDSDVQILEEALSRRRLMKLCSDEFDKHYSQKALSAAFSAGFKPDEIQHFIAPNYRQLGKNPENDLFKMNELLTRFLPFSEYIEDFTEDQIDEEHEQYSAVFNQFRRGKYLTSIELKIGNKYELKLGSREVYTKEMYLVRIDGNIKHSPELYFSLNNENSSGTNISVYKIVREIK